MIAPIICNKNKNNIYIITSKQLLLCDIVFLMAKEKKIKEKEMK